tara:strand:- start:375 stop:710 length:336 start_codon:yes stop_codon:yes gene_type:complete
MKSTELKKLIKEAVKEAIQEELKEVLLEAVRAPKITNTAAPSQVLEAATPSSPPLSPTQQREAYQNILGGMQDGFTTNQVPQKFTPTGGMPGGDLPAGEVDMSQIMSIMGK